MRSVEVVQSGTARTRILQNGEMLRDPALMVVSCLSARLVGDVLGESVAYIRRQQSRCANEEPHEGDDTCHIQLEIGASNIQIFSSTWRRWQSRRILAPARSVLPLCRCKVEIKAQDSSRRGDNGPVLDSRPGLSSNDAGCTEPNVGASFTLRSHLVTSTRSSKAAFYVAVKRASG